jgi:glyoxylase-like metal-dependent hydrolase (beta-lactamase superfamily II)
MRKYVTQKDEKGYDSRWKIGDVEVFKITETYVPGPFVVAMSAIHQNTDFSLEGLKKLEWMIPAYADKDWNADSFMGSLLIKYNGKNILLDTGGGYEGPYFENLKAAGCTPDDIDYVMFTHLHSDHVIKNVKLGVWSEMAFPAFPKAKYLFNKENYDFLVEMQNDPGKRRGYEFHDQLWTYRIYVWPLVEHGVVEFIDDTFTMDGVISLASYPGHMPGEVGVWIKSKGDSMLLSGDVIQSPYQFVQLRAAAKWEHDIDQVAETRKKILETLAGTDTYIRGYHWPTGGYVVKTDTGYQLVPEK